MDVIYRINQAIVNPLIIFMFSVALLYFAWGVLQFIFYMDSEEKRDEGKMHMLWGIVGMFIMFGVFGIIQIILGTFGITYPSGLPTP